MWPWSAKVLRFIAASHALFVPALAEARNTHPTPAHDRIDPPVTVTHVKHRSGEALPRLERSLVGARGLEVRLATRGIVANQNVPCPCFSLRNPLRAPVGEGRLHPLPILGTICGRLASHNCLRLCKYPRKMRAPLRSQALNVASARSLPPTRTPRAARSSRTGQSLVLADRPATPPRQAQREHPPHHPIVLQATPKAGRQ
jgi:hypothetical protein